MDSHLPSTLPPPSSGGRLISGSKFWLKGALFTLKHPRLWFYFALPLVLNFFVTTALLYWSWELLHSYLPDVGFHNPVSEWKTWGFWWAGFKACFVFLWQGLLWLLAVLMMLLLYMLGFVYLASVIGSPFYDRLSLRVEEENGRRHAERPFTLKADVGLPMLYALKMGAFQIFFALLCFPVSFVPLLGSLIYVALMAVPVTLNLIAYCMERRFIGFRDQLKAAWQWRYDYLGFGMVAFLTMAPFGLGIVTLPLSVVGATLLFLERNEDLNGQS